MGESHYFNNCCLFPCSFVWGGGERREVLGAYEFAAFFSPVLWTITNVPYFRTLKPEREYTRLLSCCVFNFFSWQPFRLRVAFQTFVRNGRLIQQSVWCRVSPRWAPRKRPHLWVAIVNRQYRVYHEARVKSSITRRWRIDGKFFANGKATKTACPLNKNVECFLFVTNWGILNRVNSSKSTEVVDLEESNSESNGTTNLRAQMLIWHNRMCVHQLIFLKLSAQPGPLDDRANVSTNLWDPPHMQKKIKLKGLASPQ